MSHTAIEQVNQRRDRRAGQQGGAVDVRGDREGG
jgi:hypothetical protein